MKLTLLGGVFALARGKHFLERRELETATSELVLANASEFPGDVYAGLMQECTPGNPHGPPADIAQYMATKNGLAFFFMVKATALRPPTLFEYETYFMDFGTFKCGTSLLMLEQQYLQREFATRIGVHELNMTDQVVAITGASSGIGLALAIECSKRGATVYGVARSRDIFGWHSATARSSGHEVYVQAKATGNAFEAATAFGWKGAADQQAAETFMNSTHKDKFRAETNDWLLPQTHYPIYSGQIAVPGDVLDRIIFDEVDVRNASAVAWWLSKIRTKHTRIDYLLLSAQTQLGATETTSTVEEMLADAEMDSLLTYDEIIAKWPNRQAGTGRASNRPEFEIGVKYLLAKLVSLFGADIVKSYTDIQFMSNSFAGNTMVTFDRGGKQGKGFMDGDAGWLEYAEAKRKGWQLQQLMAANGYRINSIAPTVFNTPGNMNWVRNYMTLLGQPIGPAYAISADNATGKFFYDLDAKTVHDAYTFTLNVGNSSSLGQFVGGSTYGALQLLGVYVKDKALKPMQRRTVFLDNPAVFIAGVALFPAFGPMPATLQQNGQCFDYTDPAQSVGYLNGWKLWNPAAGLAEYWSVPSLAYLVGNEGSFEANSLQTGPHPAIQALGVGMRNLLDGCSTSGTVFSAWGSPREEEGDQRAGEAVCCNDKGTCTRRISSGAGEFNDGLSHENCITPDGGKLDDGVDTPSWTWAEAKAHCEAAGLRLPHDQEEMDTACGTGCHKDFTVAWIG